MKAAVDDSELIPSLLDDFGIGARRRSGTLQALNSKGVIAEEHFGTAKIVVGMKEIGLRLQRSFDEFLALFAITFFNGEHAQFVLGENIVGVDFKFAEIGIFGFLNFP